MWCVKSVVNLTNSEEKLEPFVLALPNELAQLRDTIEPLLHSMGFELVWLTLGAGNNLAVFVDKAAGAGISVDELAQVSRLLGDVLDVKLANDPLLSRQYTLEVSSPGLDRPLSKRSHFAAACGQQLLLKCVPGVKVDGAAKIAGELVAVREEGISVLGADKKERQIDYKMIGFAHKVWRPARVEKSRTRKQ